jgi:hypothetical protein
MTFARWLHQAAAETERFGVRPAAVPHRVWRDVFIKGATPREAAVRAEAWFHNNMRSAAERRLQRRTR